jgi:hypothetical protein
MASVVSRRGAAFTFPAEALVCRPFPAIFSLGVDFSHFLRTYLLRGSLADRPGRVIRSEFQNKIRFFAESVRELNILPVFVINGLHRFPSFYEDFFAKLALPILLDLRFHVVFAPADACAQLAALLHSRRINAIWSSFDVALYDVPVWIHYFDFEFKRALILRSTNIRALLNVPTFCCHICSPFLDGARLRWRCRPPLFECAPARPDRAALSLITRGLLPVPTPCHRPSLPNRCQPYFESLAGLMLVLFRFVIRLPLSAIEFPAAADDFLPLMLQQNRASESVPADAPVIAGVLAQQNTLERPLATLLGTLQSISAPAGGAPQPPEFVITEATRRFLVALEYVAPGGGLSAWGRAVLGAGASLHEVTLLFIELIRGDAMDAHLGAAEIAVSVMDIIERTFSLFECESALLFEPIGRFDTIVGTVLGALGNLIRLIACGVFMEVGAFEPLEAVVARLPFQSARVNGAGAMMRFLCESSEEQVRAFSAALDQPGRLEADVRAALLWWETMSRATGELKQRSLKPNSRVSNLKNTLVLFECADDLLRSRAAHLMQWICP